MKKYGDKVLDVMFGKKHVLDLVNEATEDAMRGSAKLVGKGIVKGASLAAGAVTSGVSKKLSASDIAQNLLAMELLSQEQVAQATGLSLSEVEKLAARL